MMLILRRRQSVLHHRQMNRPRVWIYPQNQGRFEEITGHPAMYGFYREHFRVGLDFIKALCRILSPFMKKEALPCHGNRKP